ncbi:MAG: hypothetical protein IT165_03755 [Bryobacterales bacterium]|nr:hypothetical protein [Bryobacterales bacterium]
MGLTAEQEWLVQHEKDYAGQWVALDGQRLVACGTEGKEVFQRAKEAGVQSPFLVFVEEGSQPFGGW